MKIVHFLGILLIALAPPVILLTDDKIGFLQFAQEPEPHQPTRASEIAQYKKQLDAGFKAFEAAYKEEFAAHQQDVLKQWGEFKDPPPSVWVSYEVAEGVRRTVDYETGEVQVEMIVERDTHIDQLKGKLDKAVYRLMNSTQKQAYQSDVVANRVEQRLSGLGNVVQTGELSDERLFSLNDLVAIRINHDGYFRVAASNATVALTDVRAAAKKGREIFRVSFKIPHSIHREAVKYAAAVQAAADKENIDEP